jgi:hypothetical protein
MQQDRSGGSYDNVIYLLIAIKAWQVCLGPIYDFLDGKLLGHALRKSERKRTELRALDKAAYENEHISVDAVLTSDSGTHRRLTGWRPSRLVCRIVGTELGCAIVVAWVVSAS